MRKRIVKFEIQDLLPIGLTFVVAGIGLVYGLNVMGDMRSDMCGDTGYLWNSSASKKMPLIATVIIAAVIIGILVRYLMVRFA